MNSCALIITFNRLAKLKKCLDASIAAGFDLIVIVNNGSTDGTAEWLMNCPFTQVRVLSLPDNTGGAGGFSYGLRHIAQHVDTDWVFLYDDDAYPVNDIIARFLRVNMQYKYAAYCGKVVDLEGNVCRMNLPFIYFPDSLRDDIRYVINRDRFIVGENYQQVSSFSFVGAILEKDFIARNLDGLHPELFLYFDDVYFSYSACLKGDIIFYFPEVIFHHDINVDVNNVHPEWKVYYLIRNIFLSRFIFKSSPPFGWFAMISRVIKYTAIIILQKRKREYAKYIIKGIWHGVKGKKGKLVE